MLRIRALLFGFGSHLSGLSERCFPSIRLAHGLIRIRNTPLDHSTFNPNILYNVYTIFKLILVFLCFIQLYCTIPPSFYLWCPCPPPPHLYLYISCSRFGYEIVDLPQDRRASINGGSRRGSVDRGSLRYGGSSQLVASSE